MGAWSWGVGGNGGDRVFGNTLTKEDLWPVFRRGMELGLNLWDTAAVYGMGASETILGEFVDDCDRDDLYISTKFTPQIAKDVVDPHSGRRGKMDKGNHPRREKRQSTRRRRFQS